MTKLTNGFIVNFFQDRGEYFGVVGAIANGLSTILSLLIHSLIDSSFTIALHPISDLGTGPEISRIIYNVGLITISFFQYPLFLSVRNYLHKKEGNAFLIKIATLSALISTISHNILSLVPFERNVLDLYLIHGSAAAIHYVGGSIALVFYGFIEILTSKVSKILVTISFIAGALYGILWMGYLFYFIIGIPPELINHSL
ncbi:MAG: hypothetical protein ACFE8G_10890, partial [Candidatus Hermodarchaeota archaeon]